MLNTNENLWFHFESNRRDENVSKTQNEYNMRCATDRSPVTDNATRCRLGLSEISCSVQSKSAFDKPWSSLNQSGEHLNKIVCQL